MVITINGKKETLDEGLTLEKLLDTKGIRKEVVTVELNSNNFKRKIFVCYFKNNDVLEFIYYMEWWWCNL